MQLPCSSRWLQQSSWITQSKIPTKARLGTLRIRYTQEKFSKWCIIVNRFSLIMARNKVKRNLNRILIGYVEIYKESRRLRKRSEQMRLNGHLGPLKWTNRVKEAGVESLCQDPMPPSPYFPTWRVYRRDLVKWTMWKFKNRLSRLEIGSNFNRIVPGPTLKLWMSMRKRIKRKSTSCAMVKVRSQQILFHMLRLLSTITVLKIEIRLLLMKRTSNAV